jgi:NADPH:quinone reductase-like Zn-dependent oxidoreductase
MDFGSANFETERSIRDATKSVLSVKSIVQSGASQNYALLFISPMADELDEIRTKFVKTGKVKPVIDAVFDWRKNGVEALHSIYEKSKTGKAQGKFILKISKEN